jgi:serine/threonine protein kinase
LTCGLPAAILARHCAIVSTGPGKDVPPQPPENLSADSAEDLLTSEDLFGDLVDEPLAPEGTPHTPARATPIRVQINEAGESAPPRPRTAQLLPEDMPGLLDAFADPLGERAAAAEPAAAVPEPEPRVGPEPVSPKAAGMLPPLFGQEEDLTGLLDSMAPTEPTPSPEPEPQAERLVLAEDEAELESKTLAPGQLKAPVFDDDLPAASVEEDLDLDGLLDGDADQGAKTLAPGRMKAPVFDAAPPAPRPPRPAPVRAEAPPTDLDQLLEGVFGSATAPARPGPAGGESEEVPGLGELLKSVPQPASRTATRFQAAEPKIEASGESRMMLDLAGLAEDAMTMPAPSKEAPTKVHATGVGDDFGPYRLMEKVAAGGMAEVFRAKRAGVEGFEKIVAVKRILPHLSDNKEFVDMFIDEAKMVAGLNHPNIVQIFDLGRIDLTYFIAMEYVHGRDLRSILRECKDRGTSLPIDLAVLITGRVAAALEYAHRKKDETGRPLKIVHRDVSPQNILISFEGDVKLTDFGIAKATSKATSTDRGALRGKLLYMSPEQATGKTMDKRADVFSLGVCFYEMITDRKPFMGTSEKSILEMVRECHIPTPSSVSPRVPKRIETIAMKALDRDPDRRYQDAGEMLRDLERALPDRQPPSALELSRFMEVLFGHGEGAGSEPAAEAAAPAMGHALEIDLEPDEVVIDEAVPGESIAGGAEPEAVEPRPAPEQAGFSRLLKKFGIK